MTTYCAPLRIVVRRRGRGFSDSGSQDTARVGDEIAMALFDLETHGIARAFELLQPTGRCNRWCRGRTGFH